MLWVDRLGAAQMCWAAPHSNLCTVHAHPQLVHKLLQLHQQHAKSGQAWCSSGVLGCTSPQPLCIVHAHPNLCALCMLTPTSVHCACSNLCALCKLTLQLVHVSHCSCRTRMHEQTQHTCAHCTCDINLAHGTCDVKLPRPAHCLTTLWFAYMHKCLGVGAYSGSRRATFCDIRARCAAKPKTYL